MSDNEIIKPVDPVATARSSITLEIPGVKLSLSGLPALGVFFLIVVLISGISLYLLTARSENLSSIIRSINPKSDTTSTQNKNELLQFFLPSNSEYKKNHAEFEAWLEKNTGWWAKTPMINTRVVDGKKVILDGYWYQTQDPVTGGELENNQYGTAIQNRAVKMLGVTDLNMLWIELQKREVQ